MLRRRRSDRGSSGGACFLAAHFVNFVRSTQATSTHIHILHLAIDQKTAALYIQHEPAIRFVLSMADIMPILRGAQADVAATSSHFFITPLVWYAQMHPESISCWRIQAQVRVHEVLATGE